MLCNTMECTLRFTKMKTNLISSQRKNNIFHFHNIKTTIVVMESLILEMSIWVENTGTKNWQYFCVAYGRGGDCWMWHSMVTFHKIYWVYQSWVSSNLSWSNKADSSEHDPLNVFFHEEIIPLILDFACNTEFSITSIVLFVGLQYWN